MYCSQHKKKFNAFRDGGKRLLNYCRQKKKIKFVVSLLHLFVEFSACETKANFVNLGLTGYIENYGNLNQTLKWWEI